MNWIKIKDEKPKAPCLLADANNPDERGFLYAGDPASSLWTHWIPYAPPAPEKRWLDQVTECWTSSERLAGEVILKNAAKLLNEEFSLDHGEVRAKVDGIIKKLRGEA